MTTIKEKIFLNKSSLTFLDKKYNDEYDYLSLENLKRSNLNLNIFLTFSSIIILIYINFIFTSSKKRFLILGIHFEEIQNTNLTKENLEKLTVINNKYVLAKKAIISNFENNSKSSNFSSNNDCNIKFNGDSIKNSPILNEKENNLCYNHIYILKNEMKYDHNYLKDSLNKVLFTNNCINIEISYIVLNVFNLLITVFSKKLYILKLNFIIILLFMGNNFHIISGILRYYFSIENGPLFFIISLQLFTKILIVLNVKISWWIIFYTSILKTLFDFIICYSFYFELNQNLLFYFLVCITHSIICNLVSYYTDMRLKIEYFWQLKAKYKDSYLINFLYNTNQGFLSFKQKEIILMNRSMEKILNKFNNTLNLTEGYSKKFFMNKFYKENKPIENSLINKHRKNISFNENQRNDSCILDDSKIILKQENIKIGLNNSLDTLLENISEVNEKLPEKLQKELKRFVCSEKINSQNNNSKNTNDDIANFNYFKNEGSNTTNYISKDDDCNKIKNNKNSKHFRNNRIHKFKTAINKTNIKIDCLNSENFKEKSYFTNKLIPKEDVLLEKELMDLYLNNNKLTSSILYILLCLNRESFNKDIFVLIGKITFQNKKDNIINLNQFELRGRVFIDKNEERIDIILNEISDFSIKEKEQLIKKCRSIYLLKTAHEFINPITSSLELINIMEEDLDNENQLNIINDDLNLLSSKIENRKNNLANINYLKNLYFIMQNFIKDFSYFCEKKITCKSCITSELCKECNFEEFCKICMNCKVCNKKFIKDVNINQILKKILNIFKNLIEFEGRENFKIDLKYKINENFVMFNPDYLMSIIFNIVYYFFKRGDPNGKIEICVDYQKRNFEYTKENSSDKLEQKSHYINNNNKTFKNAYFEYPENSIKENLTNNKAILPETYSEEKKENKIIINIKIDNINYEFENKIFSRNKDILSYVQPNDFIESYGYEEFDKSFQIYVAILLCDISNTSLKLNKINEGCEYNLECVLSPNNENENGEKDKKKITNDKLKYNHINNLSQINSKKSSTFNEDKNIEKNSINNDNIIKNDNFPNTAYSKNKFTINNNDNPPKINDTLFSNRTFYRMKSSSVNENIMDDRYPEENLITITDKINYKNIRKIDENFSSNIKRVNSLIKEWNILNNDKEISLSIRHNNSLDNSNISNKSKYLSSSEILKVNDYHACDQSFNIDSIIEKNPETKFNKKEEEDITISHNNNLKNIYKNNLVIGIKKDLKENLFLDSDSFGQYKIKNSITNQSKILNDSIHLKIDFPEFIHNSNINSLSNVNSNISDNNKHLSSLLNESESTVLIKDLKLVIQNRNSFKLDNKRSDISSYEHSNSFNSKNCKGLQDNLLKNVLDKYSFGEGLNRTKNTHMENNNLQILFENKQKSPSLFLKKKIFKRVLIIDDELLIRSSLRRYFTKLNNRQENINYTTYEASNAFEAIINIYNLLLEKIHIDFIIIDEHMPYVKGSQMIYFFKSIAKENNFYKIKFISYTAFNTNEIREIIRKKGADYIMNKPVSYDNFFDIIKDF